LRGSPFPASIELARSGGGSEATNAANPVRHQVAIHLEPRMRSKPSRWCKTTRVDRDQQLVAAGRRKRQRFWEWTQAEHVGGGALNEQAHERQVGSGGSETTRRDATSGASGRSERSQDHEGRLEHFLRFASRKAIERGEDPEDQPVTGKVERVGGKDQPAAATHDGRYRPGNGHGPTFPEGPVNVWSWPLSHGDSSSRDREPKTQREPL
jgi:hypothetical protein